MTSLIDAEIAFAKQGQPAEIIIKLNNLVDSKMIRKLYGSTRVVVCAGIASPDADPAGFHAQREADMARASRPTAQNATPSDR